MSDQTDIDALLRDLIPMGYRTVLLSRDECTRHHAALTALVAERDALRKQRDEAHGLIRKWRSELVDVIGVDDMEAMTYDRERCSMDAADKRAYLAATRKEGGGA